NSLEAVRVSSEQVPCGQLAWVRRRGVPSGFSVHHRLSDDYEPPTKYLTSPVEVPVDARVSNANPPPDNGHSHACHHRDDRAHLEGTTQPYCVDRTRRAASEQEHRPARKSARPPGAQICGPAGVPVRWPLAGSCPSSTVG